MRERSEIELSIRNYGGEEDIPAITALFNAASALDGPHFGCTEEETRQTLTGPRVKPEQNVFLFEVGSQLVAYGRSELEEGPQESLFLVRGIVHPDWRRRGLGTRVLERLEAHVREQLNQVTNRAVDLTTTTDLKHEGRQFLFRKMGYEVVRYFFDMERPLRESGVPVDLPEPAYPAGIVVRTIDQRLDLHAVWQATDEAFRDHWGHTESTLEQWQHWRSDPSHRPQLWLIAWDDKADEIAGICLNGIEPEHNDRMGRQEGWIYALAVRRPYRGKGLGRALLLAGMHALQREGMDWAMLGVDTENLTGALRLYESVGFQPVRRIAGFRKPVRH